MIDVAVGFKMPVMSNSGNLPPAPTIFEGGIIIGIDAINQIFAEERGLFRVPNVAAVETEVKGSPSLDAPVL
jgi:hypothetical protein